MPNSVATPNVSYDAVIVVPGIMGSVLKDASTGEIVWGWPYLQIYSRFWASERAYRRLVPTPDEVQGQVGRTVPAGILMIAPAVAPILRGFEPYDRLVRALKRAVAHEAAVLPFAYDWRLSVEFNARRLARCAAEHLRRWREHPAARAAPGGVEPRLVIIAHSMGGLLARALTVVEGQDDTPRITHEIRATVTLGTPFAGAPKTVDLLATGRGTPVRFAHRGRMRQLAASLPGVYDLLPKVRCIEERGELRRFQSSDAAALGASEQLTEQAERFYAKTADLAIAGHRAMVGSGQRTIQAVRVDSGEYQPLHDEFEWGPSEPMRDGRGSLIRRQASGDETVPRWSAMVDGCAYLPQQHGPLAKTSEGVNFAIDVLLEREFGPRQGGAEVGLTVPDVVAAVEPWDVEVTGEVGIGARPVRVCSSDGKLVDRPVLSRRDDALVGTVTVPKPGVYRVNLDSGGTSPVTQLVLADG